MPASGWSRNHKYADACPKFEESQRLDPAIGTHYALPILREGGPSRERLGGFTSTWHPRRGAERGWIREQYAKAARCAPGAATVADHGRVRRRAGRPARDQARRRDAARRAVGGCRCRTDPGSHVIAATAPASSRSKTSVVVQDEGKVVEVQLRRSPTPRSATDGPSASRRRACREPSRRRPPRGRTASGTQRILAIAAGAGRLAAWSVGNIFGLETLSKHSSSQQQCPGNVCSSRRPPDVTTAKNAGNVSTIAFAWVARRWRRRGPVADGALRRSGGGLAACLAARRAGRRRLSRWGGRGNEPARVGGVPLGGAAVLGVTGCDSLVGWGQLRAGRRERRL